MADPRVFISYSHDDEAHDEAVLQLAQQLRFAGIDVQLDRFVPDPAEGWPRWLTAQVDAADIVVLVCTVTYRRRFEGQETPGTGHGVTFEGMLAIQHLYDTGTSNTKFIPVMFEGTGDDALPLVLRPYTRYTLPRQFDQLYRRLTAQPEVVAVPLGPRKVMLPLGTLPAEASAQAAVRSAGAGDVAVTPLEALDHLLRGLFGTGEEFRRWVARGPDGTLLVAEFPGSSVSTATMVADGVDVLNRRGHVNEDFFARLSAEFTRRGDDIARVAAAWRARPSYSGAPRSSASTHGGIHFGTVSGGVKIEAGGDIIAGDKHMTISAGHVVPTDEAHLVLSASTIQVEKLDETLDQVSDEFTPPPERAEAAGPFPGVLRLVDSDAPEPRAVHGVAGFQGDIIGGSKYITQHGGQLFTGPVTLVGPAVSPLPPAASNRQRLILSDDVKLLYARAAGRCSMSDCRIPLSAPTLSADGTSSLKIFGEMHPIVEDGPGGASATPNSSAQAGDVYDNLILLCPTHRRMIGGKASIYSADRLRAVKREHEAWVATTLARANESASDLVISYLVVRGDQGIPELQKGSASSVFGKQGFNFQIVAGSMLPWASMIRRWYGRSIGEYEKYAPIDWEKFRAMGAPLAGLRYGRVLFEEFRRRNIPDEAYLEYGASWCEIGGYTCSGQDAAHGLISTTTPKIAPDLQERRIAELRTWMLSTFETRTDRSGETTALMPCVAIREPLLYCLNIGTNGLTEGSLTLKQKGKILDVIPLQGRPILYPIGCAFEPEETGGVQIRSIDTVFQPHENDEPPDVEVAVKSMYSEPGCLHAHMVGETRLVDAYEIRDAQDIVIRSGKVRAPYRVKEYINCYLYGACCPEVLFRKNGGSWERFGPILVDALGEPRARSERKYLTNLSAGETIDVCVFEVPGERATLALQLIFSSAPGGVTLTDQRHHSRLEHGERILLTGTAAHAVDVYLHAEGYFVKIRDHIFADPVIVPSDGSHPARVIAPE